MLRARAHFFCLQALSRPQIRSNATLTYFSFTPCASKPSCPSFLARPHRAYHTAWRPGTFRLDHNHIDMQIQALGSLHQQTASGHAYSGWPTRVARRAVSRAAPWGTSASRPLASGVYGAQTAAAASSATTTALVGSGAAVSSAWASSRPTVMRYPCTPSSTPQRPARLPASGAGATWAGLPSTPAVSVGAPGLSPALCNRRRAAGIAGLGSLSGGQRRPALATAAAAAASAPAALAGAGGGAGARAIRSDSDAGDASSDSVPVVSGNSVGSSTGTGVKLQPVDYSTLAAAVAELRAGWVPAKVEQVGGKERVWGVGLGFEELGCRDGDIGLDTLIGRTSRLLGGHVQPYHA